MLARRITPTIGNSGGTISTEVTSDVAIQPASSLANMVSTDIAAFASAQLSLLDAELQAELAEASSLVSQSSPTALQRAGLAITNLVLSSQRTGLGGKTVVDLEPDSAIGGDDAPEHGIRTGDIVSVQEQLSTTVKKRVRDEAHRSTGVITRLRGRRISVALSEGEEDLSPKRLWMYAARPDREKGRGGGNGHG